MIAAPAMPKVRASWLERLYQAVQKDGVQYLYPVEERWGEIAVFPELMNEYADLLLPLLRRVWCNEPPGGYVIGGTICLSCLLEIGRYDELMELLGHARHRFWSDQRFGAAALARQGHCDAALAFAEACRKASVQTYDHRRIDRFCEEVLLTAGREEEAYGRYGPRIGAGTTYVAIYRDTLRRYSGRDARQVLLDLLEARGERGKWFAAAKGAGFLDIALECARASDADPATLVRAARDFADTNAEFSTQVALLGLRGLLNGAGYDPDPRERSCRLRPPHGWRRPDGNRGMGTRAGGEVGGRSVRAGTRAHAAIASSTIRAWRQSSAGARGNQFRASLRALPALNLGWREAATVTGSPVRGLRACPAARVATVNVPKPVSRTSSPRFSASVIAVSRLSTACSASLLRNPPLLATVATNSLLFMGVPR
jgi:hypothetical protein